MRFFGLLWDLYVGLLRVLGNTILVFVGIALCAYAMTQQFEEVRSTALNATLFAAGISLVALSIVRRLVWTSVGLAIPWAAVVAGALYLFVRDVHRFDVTMELIALVGIPPVAAAVLLELLPKPPEVIHEPHLEITIDEPLRPE